MLLSQYIFICKKTVTFIWQTYWALTHGGLKCMLINLRQTHIWRYTWQIHVTCRSCKRWSMSTWQWCESQTILRSWRGGVLLTFREEVRCLLSRRRGSRDESPRAIVAADESQEEVRHVGCHRFWDEVVLKPEDSLCGYLVMEDLSVKLYHVTGMLIRQWCRKKSSSRLMEIKRAVKWYRYLQNVGRNIFRMLPKKNGRSLKMQNYKLITSL